MTSDATLVAAWAAAYAEPVPKGWDFREFAGSVHDQEPPWSWSALAREAVSGATSVLDLGTGGGEALLEIADALPADTHATEGWAPNLPVARAALAPRRIEVAAYDAEAGDPLPYDDARFDVVLSRHEAYEASEVARVLRPGGTFLTQQVDGHNLDDLAGLFGGGPAYPDVTLPRLSAEAEPAGLRVDLAQDWSGEITFMDVTTLLRYLRLMPWQLPADFTVTGRADVLLALHRQPHPPRFTERRFVLRAVRA